MYIIVLYDVNTSVIFPLWYCDSILCLFLAYITFKYAQYHSILRDFTQLVSMRIGWIQKLVNKWPGKNTFGMYRFLPMFFVLGAALEFSMINWKVGEVNFYSSFKRRQAHDIVEEKIKKYSAA